MMHSLTALAMSGTGVPRQRDLLMGRGSQRPIVAVGATCTGVLATVITNVSEATRRHCDQPSTAQR